jgi:hypothetical protein
MKVEGNILKFETTPISPFILMEAHTPSFGFRLDSHYVVTHWLSSSSDARAASDHGYRASASTRELDSGQVGDVFVAMKYQTHSSAGTPIQEVIGFFKGYEPIFTAEFCKNAFIKSSRLRKVIHRMMMDERNIKVVANTTPSLQFGVMQFCSQEALP